MIKIAFRFDDPSQTSDHDLERRIIDLFVRHRAPLCMAVVPFVGEGDRQLPLTRNGVPHLIESLDSGLVEYAQHGCYHRCEQRTPQGICSEFSGVSRQTQEALIIKGRKQLEGVFGHTLKAFVPPFNTYDINTATAVDRIGFDYLSAGLHAPAGICTAVHNTVILPQTCTLKTINQALWEAEAYVDLSPVVVVVLHHDDFHEFRDAHDSEDHPPFTNLAELDALLTRLERDSEMRIEPLHRIAADLRPGGWRTHARNWEWRQRLPLRFRYHFPLHLILIQSRFALLFRALIRLASSRLRGRGD